MKEQWLCESERKVKAATWVIETTGTETFEIERRPTDFGTLGDIAIISSSLASDEIVQNLGRLGLSPRFRYKNGAGLFENWTTDDLTTSSSVLLDNDTDGFVDHLMAENDVMDDEIVSLMKKTLDGKMKYRFSLETCFADGVRLVSMNTPLPEMYLDVVAVEVGATDAGTFLIHRQAVEKRSKESKVLYDQDADDIRAGHFYFMNYKRGPEPEFAWKPEKYRWWHMLRDIVLAIWSIIFDRKS